MVFEFGIFVSFDRNSVSHVLMLLCGEVFVSFAVFLSE